MNSNKIIAEASYKTTICRFTLIGCTLKTCTFAHNVDEIRPFKCAFGDTCNKNTCMLYHPKDTIPTKEELWKKAIELCPPSPKAVPFIVEFDEIDEVDEIAEENTQMEVSEPDEETLMMMEQIKMMSLEVEKRKEKEEKQLKEIKKMEEKNELKRKLDELTKINEELKKREIEREKKTSNYLLVSMRTENRYTNENMRMTSTHNLSLLLKRAKISS